MGFITGLYWIYFFYFWFARISRLQGINYFAGDHQFYNTGNFCACFNLWSFFLVMRLWSVVLCNWFVHIEIARQIWLFPRLNNLSFWFITSAYILLLLSGLVWSWRSTVGPLYPHWAQLQAHPGASVDIFNFFITF